MSPSRAAGLLLHPTSLPGPHGIGDLGPAAHRFLDVLANAGCTIWQMLPLGPTGYGDSPYQPFSSFAGNPLLIHHPTCATGTSGPHVVDYPSTIAHKAAALGDAVQRFTPDQEYERFLDDTAGWLPDYALFMALKDLNHGVAWTGWGGGADRRSLSIDADALRPRVHARQVEQYLFDRQLRALRAAAHDRGIRLMGDVPIYVAHDSADTWAHRELFQLNADGTLNGQAGVPPDYFSASGQLWGNPLYNWERHRETGYAWWIARMRHAFSRFDIVRLDHFRGFESYWEVPSGAPTAIDGRWRPGPGRALFDALQSALGPSTIIAENLGEITPEVEALRETLGLPGMVVLQFGFGDDDPDNVHLPHNWSRSLVAYTGTHDNDTTLGWREGTSAPGDVPPAPEGGDATVATRSPRERALEYLDTDGPELHWDFMRSVLASVADTAIVPLQDLLGLPSESRLNYPGRDTGNWQWRFTWDQVTPEVLARFRHLVARYGREPRTNGTAPPDTRVVERTGVLDTLSAEP